MSDILSQLHDVLESRKGADPDSSYVASLYAKGLNKILEKVGEEAVETLLAARDAEVSGDNQALISETADLWFHSLVMLAKLGEHPDKVLAELERRFGLSGLRCRPHRAGPRRQRRATDRADRPVAAHDPLFRLHLQDRTRAERASPRQRGPREPDPETCDDSRRRGRFGAGDGATGRRAGL